MPAPLDTVIETLARAPAFLFLVLSWALAFFALSIPGRALTQKIMRHFKLKWVKAALLATYIETVILVFVAYFGLYLLPLGSVQTGPFPSDLRFDFLGEFFLSAGALIAIGTRNLVVAGVLALLAFPFIVLGTFVQDFFTSKPYKWNALPARAAGALIATLVLITLVTLFPWTVTALLYLFFFAG